MPSYMFGSFSRPVGPAADLRELEYVSALHQTVMPFLREDASISATDIQLYLRSRYGLELTHGDAVDIVRGLGGTWDSARDRDVHALAVMFGEKRAEKREAEEAWEERRKRVFGRMSGGGGGEGEGEEDAPPPPTGSMVVGVEEEDGGVTPRELLTSQGGHENRAVDVVNASIYSSSSTGLPDSSEVGASPQNPDGSGGEAADARVAGADGDGVDTRASAQPRTRRVRGGSEAGGAKMSQLRFADEEEGGRLVSGSAAGFTNASALTGDLHEGQDATGHTANTAGSADGTAAAASAKTKRKKKKKRRRRGDTDEEYLDLAQLTSILLVSTLLRAAEEVDEAHGLGVEDRTRPDLPEASPFRRPRQFCANVAESRRRKKEDAEWNFRDEQIPKPRRLIRNVLRVLLNKEDENATPGGIGGDDYDDDDDDDDEWGEGEAGEATVAAETAAVTVGNERLRDGLPALPLLEVNSGTVRSILEAYDECEAAENDRLVEDMVEAAGGHGAVLDEVAFARALVSDVRAYDPHREEERTETFVDVWGYEPVDANAHRKARTKIHLMGGAPETEIVRKDSDHASYADPTSGTEVEGQAESVLRSTAGGDAPSLSSSLRKVDEESSPEDVESPPEPDEPARIRGGGGSDDGFGDEEMAIRALSSRSGGSARVSVVSGLEADDTIELMHDEDGDDEGLGDSGMVLSGSGLEEDNGDIFRTAVDELTTSGEEENVEAEVFEDAFGDAAAAAVASKAAPTVGSNQVGPENNEPADDSLVSVPLSVNLVQHRGAAERRQMSAVGFQSAGAPRGVLYDQESVNEDDVKAPKYVFTSPYIDYAVDEFKSLPYTMALWVFYIFSIAVYMSLLASAGFNIWSCSPSFACTVVEKVWNWMALGLVLVAGGMLIILPISIGNNPYPRNGMRFWCSFLWCLAFSIVPFFLIENYRRGIPHDDSGVLSPAETNMQSLWFEACVIIFTIFGVLLSLRLFVYVCTYYLPFEWLKKSSVLSPSVGSADLKLSATFKVNSLVGNAHALHCRKAHGKRYKTAMQNFVINGETVESCGGLIWTWKQIISRKLLRQYGVWIFSRLCVGMEGMVILLILFIVVLRFEVIDFAQEMDQRRREIEAEEDSSLKDWALYWVPEGWMIWVSGMPALIFSALVGVGLILVYIPSMIGTVLKLRSGVIGSLHDPHFPKYRASADTIFYNVSNMVYALLGSVGFMFLLVALIIFLFLWEPTKDFMTTLLAWFIGLMITIGLKMVMMIAARSNVNIALYRAKPRSANIWALAMECWNIGLGGGVVLGRLVQFLLASAIWVGRIDVTFLDENVSFMGYGFDYTPTNFRKEILVHEAHRHPFIDRLGAMYMTRLKFGQRFASDAGACWRRLFVLALMPWLMRYRDESGGGEAPAVHEEKEQEISDESLFLAKDTRRQRGEKFVRGVVGKVKGGVVRARDNLVDERKDEFEKAKRRQKQLDRRTQHQY